MSIIIEATATRIRPTLRSASAHSLLRPMYCSRVTVDNVKEHEQVRVPAPLAVPWPWPRQLILMNFV